MTLVTQGVSLSTPKVARTLQPTAAEARQTEADTVAKQQRADFEQFIKQLESTDRPLADALRAGLSDLPGASRAAQAAEAEKGRAFTAEQSKLGRAHQTELEKLRQAGRERETAINLPAEYQNALSRAIMNVTPTRRDLTISTAERLAANGQFEELKGLIRQAAVEGEPVDI